MSFDFSESVTLVMPDVKTQMTSFAESADYRENNKIITEIAAIHAGLTSNYNMYTAEALEGSLNSWVSPYPRPIIMNHDEYSEPVGRVMGSTMAQEEDGTRYVLLQAAIIDPSAIEKVLDQRYLTGSVGGSAQSAKCSICGTDWAKESNDNGLPCRHQRGKVYEGKLAYFELGELSFREYSFVNIPADQNSGVRSTTKASGAQISQAEDDSKWMHTVKMYAMDMNRPFISEMTASNGASNILESFSKKRATAQYMNLKGSFLSVAALDYAEKDGEIGEITEAVNTINNELAQDSDEVILSQLEESRKEKAMPGTEVTTTEEEDDILAVSEQLSADMAADAGSAEDAEESITDEGAEELSESSDEKADTEDSDEVVAEDSDKEEEEEEQLTDSDEAAEQAEAADSDAETEVEGQEDDSKVESPSGDKDEEEEEKADTPQESADTEDTVLAELNSTIDTLQAENAKLRNALHRMLVERVVDAKVAKGVEEAAQRATLIEEHSKRTASSLADALRDLERYPSKAPVAEAEIPELERRTAAIGKETNASVEDEKVEEAKVDGYKVAEDIFTDALMGRKKLR